MKEVYCFFPCLSGLMQAPIGLTSYLLISAVLFSLGITACLYRRNAIGILIGIELLLNAAILNFMAFSRFVGISTIEGQQDISGLLFGVFIIVLAACEAAIALAVLLNMYFNFSTIGVDRLNQLKN